MKYDSTSGMENTPPIEVKIIKEPSEFSKLFVSLIKGLLWFCFAAFVTWLGLILIAAAH